MKRFSRLCRHTDYHFSLLLLLLLHIATCQEGGDTADESASASRLVPYIIGREAPKGRFPYVCSLSAREDGLHQCGGVLIRRRWVVTAAHCVDPEFPNSIGRNPLVRCAIHELDVNDPDKAFSGEESHWPESWTGDLNDGYDIAVVKLNKETNLTVPSIETQGGSFREGKLFTALGWGQDENGHHPNSLQMTDNLINVNHRHCKTVFENAVKNHSICAGLGIENTCTGDSGGPLLIPNRWRGNISAGIPELDLLIGVTSTGAEDCSDKSPSIYTSIGAFWDWILEIIGDDPEERDPQVPIEPSPPGRKDTGSSITKHPENETTGKEESKQPAVEKERERLRDLSQTKLLKEAIKSIRNDNVQTLEAALLEGLSPEASYSASKMPGYYSGKRFVLLHWSAGYNAPKCTKVLLRHGASVDKVTGAKVTSLHLAAQYGHTKVAKILLRHDAKTDVVQRDKWTPLHLAARNGHADIAEVLLKHKADIEATTATGSTPLHLAAPYGHWKTVDVLIEHGANVNAVSVGSTALLLAAEEGYPIVVEMLLKAGADVDQARPDRWTPLHMAARYGHSEIVEVLLKYKADINAVAFEGQSPLHTAAKYGYADIAKVLVSAGACLRCRDGNGKRPLMLSVLLNTLIAPSVLECHWRSS